MNDITKPLAALGEKWRAPIVARTEIREFSGGALSEKYMANLDSSGMGPAGRFRCGRKICYPVDSLIQWMADRSRTVGGRADAG